MSGDKYPFTEVPENDIGLLFTTKLQEDARVGCLRGVFDTHGGISTDWLAGNDTLKSPAFGEELHSLLETLRDNGPLKDICAMRQFCREHPQARMSDRQTFYAFRVDTTQHRYYLRFFPQKEKFYIFCYRLDHFREDLPTPDFTYLYRGRKKQADFGHGRQTRGKKKKENLNER